MSQSTWIAAAISVYIACAGAHSAEFKVTVTAGKADVPLAVVTAELPSELVNKDLRLVDAAGNSVPVQADTKSGKPAFTFVVHGLGAGQSSSYVLCEGIGANSEGVEVKQVDAGADVTIDGKPFTTYQVKNGPKPYLWPILGPTGQPMTRAYPMKEVDGEAKDHVHHRGMWFTFDRVNDADFWSEGAKAAKTVHREFLATTSGPVFGEIAARVDWITAAGESIAEDLRKYRFYRVPDARLIDFSIAMKSIKGPLKFGDSKEGLFAIRVAETMKVDRLRNRGRILNSAGNRDGAAWGKRAEWCDYVGYVGDDLLGIAIFDAPTNFRHPTYWHVRTYGLFAANPFGISFFTNDKKQNGEHEVPEGKPFNLSYRVYIHKGDTESAKVAEWFAAYAKPPTVSVQPK